jgi:acetolactate synthase-1/2/3 large subunit
VLTTIEGRGTLPEDHPLAVGPNADMMLAGPLISSADVVLAVGTRFEENSPMAQGLAIPGRLLHLDVDPGVLNRVHRAEVAIAGDGRLGLEQLVELVGTKRFQGGLAARGREVRAAIEVETRDAMGPDYERLLDAMLAGLTRDAIVVKDVTIAAYLWGNRLIPVYAPRTSMRPTSMGIGPGLPLGIGAAVASGRTTVVLTGDGGLMLSVAELATAVQEHLPLVVCVLNDCGYGILRHVQDLAFGARHVGVDLVTPDFAALAQAAGMASARVSGTDGFEEAFARAVASREPWLIDVDIRGLVPMQLRPQRPSGR